MSLLEDKTWDKSECERPYPNPFPWQHKDQPLPSDSYTFNPQSNQHQCNIGLLSNSTSGRYSCQLRHKTNSKIICQTDTNIILDGQEPKILKTNFSTSQENIFKEGDNITLRVFYSGNPVPNIVWLLDNEQLPPAAHTQTNLGGEGGEGMGFVSTIFLDSAYPDDSGTYTCNVRNRLGVNQVLTKLVVNPDNTGKAAEEAAQHHAKIVSEAVEDLIYDEIDEAVEEITDNIVQQKYMQQKRQHEDELEKERIRQFQIQEREMQIREEKERHLREQQRLEQQKREQEERLENEKREHERRENERIQADLLEAERQEAEHRRQELDRQEREREIQMRRLLEEQERKETMAQQQQQIRKLPELFPKKDTAPTNIESIENLMPGRVQEKMAQKIKVDQISKLSEKDKQDSLRHIPEHDVLGQHEEMGMQESLSRGLEKADTKVTAIRSCPVKRYALSKTPSPIRPRPHPKPVTSPTRLQKTQRLCHLHQPLSRINQTAIQLPSTH